MRDEIEIEGRGKTFGNVGKEEDEKKMKDKKYEIWGKNKMMREKKKIKGG